MTKLNIEKTTNYINSALAHNKIHRRAEKPIYAGGRKILNAKLF